MLNLPIWAFQDLDEMTQDRLLYLTSCYPYRQDRVEPPWLDNVRGLRSRTRQISFSHVRALERSLLSRDSCQRRFG